MSAVTFPKVSDPAHFVRGYRAPRHVGEATTARNGTTLVRVDAGAGRVEVWAFADGRWAGFADTVRGAHQRVRDMRATLGS